jgi:hypothetical protein
MSTSPANEPRCGVDLAPRLLGTHSSRRCRRHPPYSPRCSRSRPAGAEPQAARLGPIIIAPVSDMHGWRWTNLDVLTCL